MPGARIANGERITLRTVEQEDVPFLQRGTANAELRYSLGSRLMNQTQVEEEILDHSDDQFLVCLDETDAGSGQPPESETKPIGVVFVEDADWRRPELVYWLVPAVHGDGYGKEALSLVIDYVFRTYAHPAVGAGVYEFNEVSQNLLTSLGFSEEGRIRKNRFVDGDYVDTIQYGLLRTEWSAHHCDE
ncbi:GNAT family N-acetyltransferase [Halalkalicoccus jeotgali]|uniref:Protein N-acetyltransferase-like protein n=1 Tax=Halalkalicoccus jeotgali (strain DSM 18796 / CECT 7217 / JCM 14584 / KCTC 4019 / B3) TaxID=795797 RepID=D8JBM3_HALJB|nr:GNAT family protein [Halalkalicoccus jeotgali]ADJ16676.1 protein N-acetyltransferase-like protein [Halalkalicoccus jeotgali B3]ELY39061.1 protein N-acetyltransferase-like protein [Halalkalicoccus jeotgali B3]